MFRIPKQILRLEKGSPTNYFWLKGFGLETVQLQVETSKWVGGIKGIKVQKFYTVIKWSITRKQ